MGLQLDLRCHLIGVLLACFQAIRSPAIILSQTEFEIICAIFTRLEAFFRFELFLLALKLNFLLSVITYICLPYS